MLTTETKRNIKEFTDGLTVIGGSPYEVDVDDDRHLISITVKSMLGFPARSLTNVVSEIRDFFQMPETDYPVVSILKTKKGIRIRFRGLHV